MTGQIEEPRRLPSVAELMKQSKKKKSAISSLQQAIGTIKITDLDGIEMSELSLRDRGSWAVAKHGFSTVVKAIN